MLNTNRLIAQQICASDLAQARLKWLAEEQAELALRIRNLDEIPTQALLPLSHLAAVGSEDVPRLSVATDIDESRLEELLDRLVEFQFVREGGRGYVVTESGTAAFDAVAQKIVIREAFELRRRLEHAEHLRRALTGF